MSTFLTKTCAFISNFTTTSIEGPKSKKSSKKESSNTNWLKGCKKVSKGIKRPKGIKNGSKGIKESKEACSALEMLNVVLQLKLNL